ncbi:PilW family protein [Thioalkalivibrio sp. ALE9]|uniref:PilW family protein n=1 Tax=Thioalkalivibrio sp. ALE9 TaxID=1158169 RepID=UPI000477948B|nr:PilW family protein [Thioalkalivibrio sp. ALE9]
MNARPARMHYRVTTVRGLTLVELMVAMLIGLLLIGGTISIFISTQQTYRTQEAMSRVQETGRFAIERIARDARQAGYAGCPGGNINNLLNVNDAGYDPSVHDNVQAFTAPPGTLPDRYVRGDVLTINRMGTSDRDLVAAGNGSGNVPPIVLDGAEAGIPMGTVVLVVDRTGGSCERFQHNANENAANLNRSQSPGGPGNLPPSSANYTEFVGPIELLTLSSTTYFVGESTSDPNRTSLFRQSLSPAADPREVAEGVYDMSIEYGLDDNGNARVDRYVASGDMTTGDWENAAAVRVHLLVNNGSEDNVVEEARSNLYFGGNLFDAPDRRLYQTFTTTIAARNLLE